jgi:predicted AAA+ superfamily ATPase
MYFYHKLGFGLIPRKISEIINKSKKSILLLGPRQTGKSTLIGAMSPRLSINLMHEPTFFEFSRDARELENRLRAVESGKIFIDEIQRLPSLLNTIQTLIDRSPRRFQFLLTGSSARKLKRDSANLLPGRIHVFHLGPLVASELGYRLDTQEALTHGTLPGIYTSDDVLDKQLTLSSYAATYLQEEIKAENLTKNIEGFSRFLALIGVESAKYLDLSKLASDALVPRQTAGRFFEILEDTMIVRRCEAFAKSQRRRLVRHPKFFFFDNGVLNGLLRNFTVSEDRIGRLFETLFFNQIFDSCAAMNIPVRISNYRTSAGAEVDFIIEMPQGLWAVELKASRNVGSRDLSGLKSFREFYGKPCRAVVAYLGEHRKAIDDIEILPWQVAIQELLTS